MPDMDSKWAEQFQPKIKLWIKKMKKEAQFQAAIVKHILGAGQDKSFFPPNLYNPWNISKSFCNTSGQAKTSKIGVKIRSNNLSKIISSLSSWGIQPPPLAIFRKPPPLTIPLISHALSSSRVPS
jgi:hypothetical protein